MKAIPARTIREMLWRLGLRPRARGNATGHEVWVSPEGRACKPKLRRKDMPMAVVFSLCREMDSRGIVSSRQFWTALRAA